MFAQIVSRSPVKLLRDLPELSLRAGDVGIVRSSWHYPTVAYEVEFKRPGTSTARVLLLDEQVRMADAAPTFVEPSAN